MTLITVNEGKKLETTARNKTSIRPMITTVLLTKAKRAHWRKTHKANMDDFFFLRLLSIVSVLTIHVSLMCDTLLHERPARHAFSPKSRLSSRCNSLKTRFQSGSSVRVYKGGQWRWNISSGCSVRRHCPVRGLSAGLSYGSPRSALFRPRLKSRPDADKGRPLTFAC